MDQMRGGKAAREEVVALDEKLERLIGMARARRTNERYRSVVRSSQFSANG
jgi:hypothetical protein